MDETCPCCAAPIADCTHCDGTGMVGPEGESWKHWLDLPLESATAVVAGIVKPSPCPRCKGTKKSYREEDPDGP